MVMPSSKQRDDIGLVVMSSAKQRDDINLAIVDYLESHGYAQSASIFRQEANVQQFCHTPVSAPPGGILQPIDGGGGGAGGGGGGGAPAILSYLAPSAVTVTGAPMLSRGPPDNTFHHHPPAGATVYSAQYIPMGVAPQSLFVHNHPSAATSFPPLTTGRFTHKIAVPNLPNLVHVKSRVYVPNQIVGILIGTKGQTIKSISAESGAVISIEGGQQKKYNNNNNGQNNGSNNADNGCAVKIDSVVPAAASDHQAEDNSCSTKPNSVAEATAGSDQQQTERDESNDEKAHADETEGGTTTTDANIDSPNTEDNATNAATVAVGQQNTSAVSAAVVAAHMQQRPHDVNPARPVFIQGYDFQVSKAQYWVFQKVADSQNKSVDEIELACEAIVPSRVIGRIIGKGGYNVKKLQQSSGARIKVPDDIRGNNKNTGDWATVSIFGNFYAVQAVQQHFGALISEAEWRDSREQDERRSRHWNGGNSR